MPLCSKVLLVICASVLFVCVAASTCACDIELGASCRALFLVGKTASECGDNTIACDRCVCKVGGSLTCNVQTALALTYTIEPSCDVLEVSYAECPVTATPTPTAAPSASGWVLSAAGETCDQACTAVGSSCNAAAITDLNSQADLDNSGFALFMQTELSHTCTSVNSCSQAQCDGPMPVVSSAGACFTGAVQTAALCGVAGGQSQRVCCCSATPCATW
eukprot:CAMPEP_0185843722 /NCGR_PEP_ID=MMETSP1354-20130828/134_1 /TAXON_ID=708628 /ORGANISM="Erythrolobus madagascarensis, Strain CCMP3276" /LENGTH=218 /DNA_ID=CAMNT_0028543263 /DNA_START=222 /DNA_END=878 /DNA_ORIENTATION=-